MASSSFSLPNPNPTFTRPIKLSIPNLNKFSNFSVKSTHKDATTSVTTAKTDRKSLAVAAGELFLGLASRLLNKTKGKNIDIGNDGDKIRKVIKDVYSVIWEQRVKYVEAEERMKKVTSPGFSFSAAGLLFPYHLGVAQFLIENGYIKAVLRDVLDGFLPDDIHTRCNGRVRVAITQLLWIPKGLLVGQFDSKEDVINAVVTSSFIPGYLALTPATIFRNRLCIDGGLTMFLPPTSASKTVGVCAFSTNGFGFKDIGISPDCNPENRTTTIQLLNWALEPADDDILDGLYELGYLDAAVWGAQNPSELIFNEEGNISD